MPRPYFPDDFVNLRHRLDQLASGAYAPPPHRARRGDPAEVVAQPIPLDVYGTDEQLVIVAAVPGIAPEDLELTIHRDTITLSGTVREGDDADAARGATWYVQELGSGAYRRSVTVPFPVDVDGAEATYQHGVLRVVLPKAQQERPHRIRITGGQQAAGSADNPATQEEVS